MKALYSERNGLPTNKVKTDIIQKDIYKFILDCCDKYHINLACLLYTSDAADDGTLV